nr:immunoglobulin light chain junction region [Macaca mulatta]
EYYCQVWDSFLRWVF